MLPFATGAATAQSTIPPPVGRGFQDGFFLQSRDGDYKLVFGTLAQVDGRVSTDDRAPMTDHFVVRRVRPTFTGRVARYVDFKVMPDFGNGIPQLMDAYVDVRVSPAFRLRGGKDKTPIGFEWLQGDAFLAFPERTIASGLVPNRDVGVQLLGTLAAGRVTYNAGVFGGIPDGTTFTMSGEHGGRDVVGRVTVQPFKSAANPRGPLNGLGFHVGGSRGDQRGALPRFRSFKQAYFSYAPGATAAGNRTRISPAVFYYFRAFGAFAEYMRSDQRVARGDTRRDIDNRAWEVTASYVLTGESASDRGVRPRNGFDPANRRLGALQLVARYADVRVDRAAFDGGLAAAGASRSARQWSVGTNWYPTPWVKWYGMLERTVFDERSGRVPEHVIGLRFQLAF